MQIDTTYLNNRRKEAIHVCSNPDLYERSYVAVCWKFLMQWGAKCSKSKTS